MSRINCQTSKKKELHEKIKGTKFPFGIIPRKVYNNNPPFTQPETKAMDSGLSKLLKKGTVKPSIHGQKEDLSHMFVATNNVGSYRLILNLEHLNENM